MSAGRGATDTMVYADHAAGSPLRPRSTDALVAALASGAGNAASAHWAGAGARALLESARERVAAAIGARPLEIVFTSGATEANNLALRGVAAAARESLHLTVGATEHASVLEPARLLAAAGHRLTVLPVSSDGLADPAAVRALAPTLLSVALVNAETGVVQPCEELGEAARGVAALVHVDAAQAVGHVPLAVTALGADLVTLSGHKLGGPPGTGALYVRHGTPIAGLLAGGAQEGGLRPGTENVPAIVAFAVALSDAVAEQAAEAERLQRLAARLRAGIRTACPEARCTAAGAPRAPHIVHVVLPEVSGESLVAALDLEGIAASAGSACAAGAGEPSHVLEAMGYSREQAACGLRLSLGWSSTAADVDRIVAALTRVLGRARARHGEAA